jgi:hypothetical protein
MAPIGLSSTTRIAGKPKAQTAFPPLWASSIRSSLEVRTDFSNLARISLALAQLYSGLVSHFCAVFISLTPVLTNRIKTGAPEPDKM